MCQTLKMCMKEMLSLWNFLEVEIKTSKWVVWYKVGLCLNCGIQTFVALFPFGVTAKPFGKLYWSILVKFEAGE